MKYPLLLLLPCALLTAADALADKAVADAVELSPQETHAVRSAEVSPADIPGSHDSVELNDEAVGDYQLDDILQQQAGIQVRHLGGRGQFSYPSIRGASGKQLQIVWDGIPLTSLNNSEGELPGVGLSALASIDIYRGIAPVELAPTAIGGTIHLKSKNHFSQPSSGSAYAAAGSFGYYSAGIWQQYQNRHWRFFAAADYMQADNDFETETELNSLDNPNEKTTERRLNNGAQHELALLRADYSGSYQWQPSVLFQHQKKRRELPGLRNLEANDAYFESDDNRLSLRIAVNHSATAQSEVISSVYKLDETYDDQGDNIGLGQQKNLYHTEGLMLRLNNRRYFSLGENLLTLSLQDEDTRSEYALLSDSTIATNCLSESDCPYDYSRRQYQLGDRLSLTLNPALMLNGQLSLVSFDDVQKNNYGIADQHNSESYTTGDIGSNIRLTENSHFEMVISRQVRPVSTQELFGDRGLTEGNPDLTAETSRGIDMVVRLNTVAGEYSLSAYKRIRNDAIVASADSRGIIKYENLARTDHKGIEFSLSIDLSRHWAINGNSGWHRHITTDSNYSAFIGKRVPNQRTWDNYYSLTYASDSWGASLGWLMQSGGFYDQLNLLPMPERNQIDWRLYYRINHFKAEFNANNLSDNRVTDFYTYPAPGRNYSIKLNYSW